MMSYTYIVKVRSAHQLPAIPPQFLPLQERGANAAQNPDLHKYATYLWGGGGLFFYDNRPGQTQNGPVSPVEVIGPRSQTLTVHVDVDGCPVEIYASTESAPVLGYGQIDGQPNLRGLYYLGQLRPGQVASFRLNDLHGIAAVCNDPSGSDSKVTCVLVTDPAEPA